MQKYRGLLVILGFFLLVCFGISVFVYWQYRLLVSTGSSPCNKFLVHGQAYHCGKIQEYTSNNSERGYQVTFTHILAKYEGMSFDKGTQYINIQLDSGNGRTVHSRVKVEILKNSSGKIMIEDRQKEYSAVKRKQIAINPPDISRYLNNGDEIVLNFSSVKVTESSKYDNFVKKITQENRKGYVFSCPVINRSFLTFFTQPSFLNFMKYQGSKMLNFSQCDPFIVSIAF